MNLQGFFSKLFTSNPESDVAIAMSQAFFGREIKEPNFLKICQKQKDQQFKSKNWLEAVFMIWMMFKSMFLEHKKLPIARRRIFDENRAEIAGFLAHYSLKDKLRFIIKRQLENWQEINAHGGVSMGSTVKSMLALKLLKSSGSGKTCCEIDIDLNVWNLF